MVIPFLELIIPVTIRNKKQGEAPGGTWEIPKETGEIMCET